MGNSHPWTCRICHIFLSEPTDSKELAEWRWERHVRKQHWPSLPSTKKEAATIETAQSNPTITSLPLPSEEPSSISCPYCDLLLQREDFGQHVWGLHRQTEVQAKDFALSKEKQTKKPPRQRVELPSDLSNDCAKLPCPECGYNVYAHILPLHIKSCHSPRDDVFSLAIPTSRLTFTLLPPGTWQISQVIEYLNKNQNQISKGAGARALDLSRIRKLQTLKPTRCHVGAKSWLGYVLFEFANSRRVVLECPFEGNATYILSGDWHQMVFATKAELRQRFADRFTKIIHKAGWLNRIRMALRD